MTTVIVSASIGAKSRAQSDHVSSDLINPNGIVYSRHHVGRIYVVDVQNGSVSIAHQNGTVVSLKTGAGPVAIALNEKTGTVYVANSSDQTVSIIDEMNDNVIATVTTAARPYAIAVDELTNKVYVSNTFSNKLTVIDGWTDTASNIQAGSADTMTVDAKNSKVYMLGYESDALTVLDSKTNTTKKLSAGPCTSEASSKPEIRYM